MMWQRELRYREYQRRMSIRRLSRLREDVMQEVRAHLVDDDDHNHFVSSRISTTGASSQEIELLRRDEGGWTTAS